MSSKIHNYFATISDTAKYFFCIPNALKSKMTELNHTITIESQQIHIKIRENHKKQNKRNLSVKNNPPIMLSY